jgi:hypothetical protein
MLENGNSQAVAEATSETTASERIVVWKRRYRCKLNRRVGRVSYRRVAAKPLQPQQSQVISILFQFCKPPSQSVVLLMMSLT